MLPKVELSYVKASAVSVTLDLQVLSKTADVERCATPRCPSTHGGGTHSSSLL